MQKIQLINTLPNVFVGRTDIASDIWNKEVEFEEDKVYLVEANSGTGKSSLCSFIYGYRRDYQGQILFDGSVEQPGILQDHAEEGMDAFSGHVAGLDTADGDGSAVDFIETHQQVD